jgi:hypothetical protein
MLIEVSLKMDMSASASLSEMEQRIQEAGHEAMRAAFTQGIRAWEHEHEVCPQCGKARARLEGTVRRTIATLFGRVQVPRRRLRCQDCWYRWCPADDLFKELQGGRISPPLREAALLAGCSWPYRVASHLLKKLSGASISAEEIRRLTNQGGKQRAKEQQEAAQGASVPNEKQPCARAETQPILVGMDGGWVCSREQRGGMEGKVAVVCSQVEDLPLPAHDPTFSWSKRGGPRRPPRQRHRLLQRRYVATFASSKHVGEQTANAVSKIDEDPTRQVVVIADGAAWIKKEQQKHFPHALGILDWAHLWREVSHAIRVVARAKGLSEADRGYHRHLYETLLWHGQVEQAIQGLQAWGVGLPAEAEKALQQAITYLRNQRDWIGSYEQWHKQGYPVGSGMIERAVALVINRRMKKRGMRWRRANATAVVALRTDLLNDDWVTPQPLRAFP